MSDPNPPTEINDAAPSSLSRIIGQRGVVAQVAVALDAAFAEHLVDRVLIPLLRP